ncbi:RNA-directed DNA polymerase, eukaryota, reverse transcriptase zinc-binding domain protein [Tanacetum coccineum]
MNGINDHLIQSCKNRKNKQILTSQPIAPSPTSLSDNDASISDSLSKIQRCNFRILSRNKATNSSESFEVDNIINLGNQIGFDMGGNKLMSLALLTAVLQWGLWNNSSFDYVFRKSVGKSGGILAIWDTSRFQKFSWLEGDGFLAIKGDYNEVRNESERAGSIFFPRGANIFNDFISSTGLHEIPIGGQRWPTANVTALTKEYSDHSPLLLNMSTSQASLFKNKLQSLKGCIKQWRKEAMVKENVSMDTLRETLYKIDLKSEVAPLSTNDIELRSLTVKELSVIDHLHLKDLRQRAKSRWALEGDENLRPSSMSNLFKRLNVDDSSMLDLLFLIQEIKDVVWSCGGEKAPWPDGFTFNEVQMAFIKGCQIIDGTLIVDEIISWVKVAKKKMGCLNSAYASVLVNGSPTLEFKIDKGLRQVGNDRIHISHLQFTDDAIIMGDWSQINVKNLSRILTCFHLASRLKVNFNKSKHFGIGVTNNELSCLASSIAWDKVIAPLNQGGLNIGSLKISNQAIVPGPLNATDHATNHVTDASSSRLPNISNAPAISSEGPGMRYLLTNSSSQSQSSPTRWNKLVPIKVNIAMWRTENRRLPTRVNLDNRGIDLDSIRCPVCDNDLETEEHILVKCDIAKSVWNDVLKWWNIRNVQLETLNDLLSLASRTTLSTTLLAVFDAVVNSAVWVLWGFRNDSSFAIKLLNRSLILNDIKQLSFTWISNRLHNIAINWIEWLFNPCIHSFVMFCLASY